MGCLVTHGDYGYHGSVTNIWGVSTTSALVGDCQRNNFSPIDGVGGCHCWERSQMKHMADADLALYKVRLLVCGAAIRHIQGNRS